MSKDFMQHQVTRKQAWVKVETTQGTEFLPVADLGLWVRDSEADVQPLTDQERETYKKQIWQYTEGEPQEWETVQGYGARLSAPGYLDCTEWTVFETPEEAEAYLAEMYDDEETDEQEEN